MRNTYKKVIMVNTEVAVYDTVKKTEEVIKSGYAEGVEQPALPKNCIKISETEVSRKEVRMKLSPEDFMKYATVVDEDEE